MVYYYRCSDARYQIYAGKDKFENELLLQHAWPEDVWFHVDDYSSAHFYLRLPSPYSSTSSSSSSEGQAGPAAAAAASPVEAAEKEEDEREEADARRGRDSRSSRGVHSKDRRKKMGSSGGPAAVASSAAAGGGGAAAAEQKQRQQQQQQKSGTQIAAADIHSIPPQVLKEVAQLTKGNSIEGRKQQQVDVLYTPSSNLHKAPDMEVGQVGFKDERLVLRIKNVSADRELYKSLEKTREELQVDVKEARQRRDREEVLRNKELRRQQRQAAAEEARRREEEKQLRSYAVLNQKMDTAPGATGDGTIESCKAIEEDFL